MRHYKTARAILRNSLEDIKAGQWCTGELVIHGTCAWINDSNGRENIADGFFRAPDVHKRLDQRDDVQIHDKPMGCAIGLVSMYGGLGTTHVVEIAGKDREFFEPVYPDSLNTTPGVLTSMRVLTETIPQKKRNLNSYDAIAQARAEKDVAAEIDTMVDVIVAYNDSLKRADARKWFKAALDKTPKS